MSTAIGLSTPVLAPLLPITGTFALPFSAYFTFLSSRVVYYRLRDKQYIGDNSSKDNDLNNPLYLAGRCHQNFTENVPIALLLAAFAELNGGNRKGLTAALSALLAFRILHVELGLITGMGIGRPIGYYGTMGTIVSLGVYATYLVKGYWGF
ncbi:membrane-associated, eicosanoid/glutathione metabolism protein [Hypomontagnella submonticulosa]|nr:membrane-associated, eicosanoid/glutathione metabolism protein [Hypomontagnella submonticulosa]